MSNNFVFDVETLDIESTAIVLSAAIVYFDPTEDVTFDELIERTCYVKFSIEEQKQVGRSTSSDTVDWWKRQGPDIQKLCLFPSPKDLSVKVGLHRLRDYVKVNGDSNSFVWARGSLDQMVIESLSRQFDLPTMVRYNMWCDVRTGIRLLKDGSDINGYCHVPGLDMHYVNKHNPIDDVCLDALMLIKGV
jgi:hypothetical protein